MYLQCSAVYTASPLQFEQCSWSVYCPCSIPYTAGCRVHCTYTSVYVVYVQCTLHSLCSLHAVIHCLYTPLRSGYYTLICICISLFHTVAYLGHEKKKKKTVHAQLCPTVHAVIFFFFLLFFPFSWRNTTTVVSFAKTLW